MADERQRGSHEIVQSRDNMYWVQISQEEDELVVQFYPHPREKYWAFSYEEAMHILENAKNKLLEL